MRIQAPHLGIGTVDTRKRDQPPVDRKRERELRLQRARNLIRIDDDAAARQGANLMMRVAQEQEQEHRRKGETEWVSPLWFELAHALLIDLWDKGLSCLKDLLRRFVELVSSRELNALARRILAGESLATA